jgi:hypothetical protein
MEGRTMMKIAQYSDKGNNYPVLICNGCGKPIKNAKMALITFKELAGNSLNSVTGVFHKGECDPGNHVSLYSDELEYCIVQLVFNIKIGRIITQGNKRQLIIDLPDEDGVSTIYSNLVW